MAVFKVWNQMIQCFHWITDPFRCYIVIKVLEGTPEKNQSGEWVERKLASPSNFDNILASKVEFQNRD